MSELTKLDWFFVGCYTGWTLHLVWIIASKIWNNAKKATNDN